MGETEEWGGGVVIPQLKAIMRGEDEPRGWGQRAAEGRGEEAGPCRTMQAWLYVV